MASLDCMAYALFNIFSLQQSFSYIIQNMINAYSDIFFPSVKVCMAITVILESVTSSKSRMYWEEQTDLHSNPSRSFNSKISSSFHKCSQ